MAAGLWLAAAGAQAGPEEALALIERGLRLHPGHADLSFARLSLLGQLERREEQAEAARWALAELPSAALEAQLRIFLADAQIELGALDEAGAECLRLQGVPNVHPELVAEAWTRLALGRELRGEDSAADADFDRALEWGARGVQALGQLSLGGRREHAAALALGARALDRHPQHPDLRLARATQHLLADDVAAARAEHGALPLPLPERLRPDAEALLARIELREGHVDQALARLRNALEDSPGDLAALLALFESWSVLGRPEPRELGIRLRIARNAWRGRPGAPQATLDALEAQLERAALSDPPEPPAPAPGDETGTQPSAEPAPDPP